MARIRRFLTYHAYVSSSHKEGLASSIITSDKRNVLHHLFRRHSRKYERLIQLLFSSARIHYPNCVCEVATDMNTEFFDTSTEILIRRFSGDPINLMQNRLHAQIEYLKSLTDDSIVYFLDSDILINRPLNLLDDDDNYSIILTTRKDERMPINGGLFIISGKQRREAIIFLERVAQIHREKYQDFAAWGGNQLALRDAVLEKALNSIPEEGNLTGGIRLLSASLYNFTPPKNYTYEEMAKRRAEYILHFKGGRRKVMRLYWLAFLNPENNFKNYALAISARTILILGTLLEQITNSTKSVTNYIKNIHRRSNTK